MKKSLIPIAVAMVAALTVVSCKNNRKAQVQEPTQEEIQEMKLALADSVLAKIDEYVEQYIKYSDEGYLFDLIELTDAEKLVKPDYLLDPSEASKFVTKKQKVSALAIYGVEYAVRSMYDMPTDDVIKVIAQLAVDVNHPIADMENALNKPASEVVRNEYKVCKERGDLAYFWQFQNAIMRETDYLFAKNPELFWGKIGEENLKAGTEQWYNFDCAIWALAPYDEEINIIAQTLISKSEDDITNINQVDYSSIEKCIETYKSDKFDFIARRNALLQ